MDRSQLFRIAVAFGFLCALAPASLAQADNVPFRLPADVAAPVRYHIDLTVIPDQDGFTGSSDITIHFAKSTPSLWLNADKLQVQQASLSVGSDTVAAKIAPTPQDYVRFDFDHPVGPGDAVPHLTYKGAISRK